ncbi:MAG: SGNH/GDSL hydrolase family protein [Actinomycetota bacterium]
MSFWTSPLMRKLRPGVAATLSQTEPYLRAWAEANERARAATGPLWVALGDSTAQGIGASAYDRGYVGQLRARLEARDGREWRVINLSRTGSRIRDVVAEQLPALAPLALEAELVTCAAGANDLLSLWFRPVPDELRSLMSGLPPGAVVATLPQGLGRRRARRLNEIIRTEAPLRQLRIADVWARTGPPWKGRFAADDFHPNEIGYRDWCDAFAEAIGVPVA